MKCSRVVLARDTLSPDGSPRTLFRAWRSAENFHRSETRGIAIFDTDFLEDATQVLLCGLFAHAENRGNITVAFALSHPEEDLRFSGRQDFRPRTGTVGVFIPHTGMNYQSESKHFSLKARLITSRSQRPFARRLSLYET